MIQIGVTGHRVLGDAEKLKAGIDQALAWIGKTHPAAELGVVSALAEGADRLVVARVFAVQPTARLVVALPLPLEEYQKDFQGAGSVQEFQGWLARAAEVVQLPAPVQREQGYWAAGLYVLDHCDVLIALWDGLEQRGLGGTGQVVSLARARGLPVAWVYTPREPSAREAGRVCWERFS